MRADIEIGGKVLPFEASAMTDHMAQKVFGLNLSYAVQHVEGNEDTFPDMIRKMAFIMHKRAVLGGWRAVEELTPEDFYDWLDGLDSYDLEHKAKELMSVYVKNKETTVQPKNAKPPHVE